MNRDEHIKLIKEQSLLLKHAPTGILNPNRLINLEKNEYKHFTNQENKNTDQLNEPLYRFNGERFERIND